jgi:hypothetical protein
LLVTESERTTFPFWRTVRETVTSKPCWLEPETVRTEPRGA